jgi:hypothetical protein
MRRKAGAEQVHHFVTMAQSASKAVNDPTWSLPPRQSSPRTITNVRPPRGKLLTRYPVLPPQVLRAWWHRMLESAGPPV